jgi:hypothetical protein
LNSALSGKYKTTTMNRSQGEDFSAEIVRRLACLGTRVSSGRLSCSLPHVMEA